MKRHAPPDTEQQPLPSGFGPETTAEQVVAGANLRGKVFVVTGGYAGIGLETTRVLTKAGATVVVGARDIDKAQAALSGMKNASVLRLDLADARSIDDFAREFIYRSRVGQVQAQDGREIDR